MGALGFGLTLARVFEVADMRDSYLQYEMSSPR
jgi:hypothetical protein